jgi:fructoselysine-6-phosphate deglycase
MSGVDVPAVPRRLPGRQERGPTRDEDDMLNFDRDRFVGIQSGAAGIAAETRALVGRLLAEGVERLFFMGTGGVQLLTLPAVDLAQRRTTFPVSAQFPAQVVLEPPAGLDRNALVVLPSLSGTTKESVELLTFLKNRGARTLSLTGHADTPLGRDADHTFTNFAEDDTSSESFYIQTLLIVLALLAARGEYDDFDRTAAELAKLPDLLADAKAAFEDEAARLAETIKDETYHIFTGAGSVWPQAHYYGMCILEEMQWIRTRPVHAADFFHGTLELMEPGVSVFVFKGEDAFRPLSDRVERFARRYTDKVRVLDAASVGLPGISRQVRALISPVVLATLLERVSAHLEVLRDHPLTTRRYYKRVEY